MMKTAVRFLLGFALMALVIVPTFASSSSEEQRLVEQADINVEEYTSFIRTGSEERELWGWNFQYLLFHLLHCDMCQCEEHLHGPCSCPDCDSHHHKPPHVQKYCNGEYTCQYSAVEGGDEGTGGSSNHEKQGGQIIGDGGGSRKTLWWLVGGIAGLATAAAAFAMRQRVVAANSSKAVPLTGDDSQSGNAAYKLMMAGGMGAAVAAMMARIGLRNKGGHDNASTSGSSGIVSQRMSQSVNGGAIPRDRSVVRPSFISIQSDTASLGIIDDTEQGFEVDGPSRPSSVYAI